MANNRQTESDELEDENFDDEEFEYYEDDETEDDDNEDDILDNPVYKKLYSKAKEDAEKAVIEAISSEDTNTPVYKGLQKVVSKKDAEIAQHKRELAELRQALGEVVTHINTTNTKSATSSKQQEALVGIIEDMLEDEDSKKVFRSRMQQVNKESEMDDLKQQIANLSKLIANQGQRVNAPTQQVDDEPEEYKIYRQQFQEQLEGFAEEAGIDPKDKRLNYGDPKLSFLERAVELRKSIKEIKSSGDDETISRARRKVAPPKTLNERGTGAGSGEDTGRSLLERGALEMTKKMRKVAFS